MNLSDEYDGTVEATEAVRRSAQRLVHEMAISLNKQSMMLNEYVSENRSKRGYRLSKISPSNWNAFAKPGSERRPLDSEMILIAWDWLIQSFPTVLKAELNNGSTGACAALISSTLFGVGGVCQSDEVHELEFFGRNYKVYYALGLANKQIACGILQTSKIDSIPLFTLSLPKFNSVGGIEYRAFSAQSGSYPHDLK